MQRVFYISEDTKDTGEQANEVKRVGNILMYRGTRFLRLKLNYMSCDAQYANNRHRYTKPKDIQTINIRDSFIHVPYNPQSDFRSESNQVSSNPLPQLVADASRAREEINDFACYRSRIPSHLDVIFLLPFPFSKHITGFSH